MKLAAIIFTGFIFSLIFHPTSFAQSPSGNDAPCVRTGCSGHICSDQQISSTCEWRETYACYADAVCERQSNGECGWTDTQELRTCLGVDTQPLPPLQCTDVTCTSLPNETNNGKNIQCEMTPVDSSVIGNRSIRYEGYCTRTRDGSTNTSQTLTEEIPLTPVLNSSLQFQPIPGLPGNYQCYFRYCLSDGNGPENCLPWGTGSISPTATQLPPQPVSPTATPAISQICTPRPACLDENPPCDAIESLEGWCTSAPYLLSLDAEYSTDSTIGKPTSNQMMWITLNSSQKQLIDEMTVLLTYDRSRTEPRDLPGETGGIILQNQHILNGDELYPKLFFMLKATNPNSSSPSNPNELVKIPFYVKDSGISLFMVPSIISVKLKSGEIQEWAVSPRYKQIEFYQNPVTTQSPSPDPSNYICPETEWINCMPSIDEPRALCTTEYIDWSKANCPGFQGAAY